MRFVRTCYIKGTKIWHSLDIPGKKARFPRTTHAFDAYIRLHPSRCDALLGQGAFSRQVTGYTIDTSEIALKVAISLWSPATGRGSTGARADEEIVRFRPCDQSTHRRCGPDRTVHRLRASGAMATDIGGLYGKKSEVIAPFGGRPCARSSSSKPCIPTMTEAALRPR
jgi:hypothetical protein